MRSTKRTKTIFIIIFTTFLSVVFLLTLHTTKITKLDFTTSLNPSIILYSNSITPHMPQIIDGAKSSLHETDYLIEDGEIKDPFIQNPVVEPEVLQLDEDTNT